ncbi:MAG: hypothetical protein AB8B96_09580 [Lysobacterales bacterium]
MKRIVGLASLWCLTMAGAADFEDPLSCVDPIVASAFLSGAGLRGIPEISDGIPEAFSGIETLEGLAYLGTSRAANPSYQQTNIGFRSAQSVDAVTQRLSDYLLAAGFKKVQQRDIASAGFKVRSRQFGLSFCSEEYGNALITARQVDSVTVANVRSYGNANQSCDTAGAAYQSQSTLQLVLPELELPPGADLTPGMGIGSSGSADGASSRASFNVDLSAIEVMAHFDQQMESQGWSPDSSWEGQRVSGSAWIRATNSRSSAGIITLANRENRYSVIIEVRKLP